MNCVRCGCQEGAHIRADGSCMTCGAVKCAGYLKAWPTAGGSGGGGGEVVEIKSKEVKVTPLASLKDPEE